MQKRLHQAGIPCSVRQSPKGLHGDTGQYSHARPAVNIAIIDKLVGESLQHGLLHRQEAFPLASQIGTADVSPQMPQNITDDLATRISAASDSAGDSQGIDSGTDTSELNRSAFVQSQQKALLKQYTSGKLSRHSLLADLARIKTAQQSAA